MNHNSKEPAAARSRRRLDVLLVELGLFSTRSQAAAAILAGEVLVAGAAEYKAGRQVAPDIAIEMVEKSRYVSRGGYKLEHALKTFDADVAGKIALDAGASTGGFSDCLLQHGAARVIAVDVGYGQFDWKLRQDPRVDVIERCNVRHLDCGKLPAAPEVATFDLSFISLKKVLPAVIACLAPGFEIIALIKPQFEAGKGKVGKGGVVRDPQVHRGVLRDIWGFSEQSGLQVKGLTQSPVKGPKGNIEFLIYLTGGAAPDGAGAGIKSTGSLDKELIIDKLTTGGDTAF